MDKAVLNVQVRDVAQKAKVLRREGLLVAEFYGHGMENMSLQMDYQEFRKLYRVAGENTVIDLKVDGGKTLKALVHRVDYDPVTDDFIHVDFINVRMDEEVTTHIPIILEGQAPAVKELGGTLMHSLDELEIRCLPGDLIHEITVDIESLVDFHSVVRVSDIKVPEKIAVVTDAEVVVVTVTPPRAEEPEQVETTDVASVEVPGEKKEEEEKAE